MLIRCPRSAKCRRARPLRDFCSFNSHGSLLRNTDKLQDPELERCKERKARKFAPPKKKTSVARRDDEEEGTEEVGGKQENKLRLELDARFPRELERRKSLIAAINLRELRPRARGRVEEANAGVPLAACADQRERQTQHRRPRRRDTERRNKQTNDKLTVPARTAPGPPRRPHGTL